MVKFQQKIREFKSSIETNWRPRVKCFSEKVVVQIHTPGVSICVLTERRNIVIPKLYLPKERLPRIRYIRVDDVEVYLHIADLKEESVKLALLLFYCHKELNNLKLGVSHWKLFYQQV